MNLYVLFAIFLLIFYLFFHIDIVYECIVLCCIVEINLLTYLLLLEMLTTTQNGCHYDFTWMYANEKHSFDSQMIDRPKTCLPYFY